MVVVFRMDSVRNEELRRRGGIEKELAVEQIRKYRDSLGMWKAWMSTVWPEEVSGGRVRGRPRLGWVDGVKVSLGNRGSCASMRKRS